MIANKTSNNSSCDIIYSITKVLEEHEQKNLDLISENAIDLQGKSWRILPG